MSKPVAGDGLTAESLAEIKAALDEPGVAPKLADAALAHLDGDANPLGAAVVATITIGSGGYPEKAVRMLDGWVAEHGLAFAACAFAESATLTREYAGRRWKTVRYAQQGDERYAWWAEERVARRLRTLLAVADEREYQEAVARLADHRRTPVQRVAVSYLVPTRLDWVEECRAHKDRSPAWMLLCSVSASHQLDLFAADLFTLGVSLHSLGVVATLVERVGAAATPLLVAVLDEVNARDATGRAFIWDDARKALLGALAVLPVDEAFQALVDRAGQDRTGPALREAARRFPARAVRLLAPVAAGASPRAKAAAEVLDVHVRAHPEVADAVLPLLPEQARALVASIRAEAATRVPDAPAEDLPPLLVAPPWTRKRKASKPVVVEGLRPPAERVVRWVPGEREEWEATAPAHYHADGREVDWEEEIARFRAGRIRWSLQWSLFAKGPVDRLRPLVVTWEPDDYWFAAERMPPILARFELDALPVALRAARANPAANGGFLLPFLDAEVAGLMADWLARLKAARRHAIAWLARHGMDAVPYLVPAALGGPGQVRRGAEAALRLLAERVGAEEVVAAARRYGEAAGAAIESMLAVDPLEILPARMPVVGDWAEPAALPQVLLRDRKRALPVDAARHLVTMLALSKPGEVYPGVGVVREACDPRSLAEFSWALFEAWQSAGAPSRDTWALHQLGLLGDDETVRRLAPLIRVWPGAGHHPRAVAGLEVLAEIGTDLALVHLHGIAQKAKFTGLRAQAQRMIERIAVKLGVTAEQLADRLVPDFGLDADGGMVLDYGPRRFRVGFDEALKPYVLDESGKRRASLPKPGAKDDPELAPAAYQRFAALRKDVRTVAADQVRRLEAAMVNRRRWSVREFEEYLVRHPLMWHIARRLVWLAESEAETVAFRIAEDRTFADVADDAFTPPSEARIGIAHPLDLGDDLAAWSELFADYAILQPFPQLGRPVHTLTEEERRTGRLARFEGVRVPVGKVIGLERHGWRRAAPEIAGLQFRISRQVTAEYQVVIHLVPGIVVGDIDREPEQCLETVFIAPAGRPDDDDPEQIRVEMDPVAASELLATLISLTGTG